MTITKQDRFCIIHGCGMKLKPWQKLTCCREHSSMHIKMLSYGKHKKNCGLEEVERKPRPPRKKYKSSITDQEQTKLNIAIDDRYAMKMVCRSIRPGDPEFESLAAQITLLDNIRKISYHDSYYTQGDVL